MYHNYTTWQMSFYWEGCFHPREKKGEKAGSASLLRSLPLSCFLSHQRVHKRPFALSPEADWKRKVARSHAALACLLRSTKWGCVSVCTCSRMQHPAHFLFPYALLLSPSLFFPWHTHTQTDSYGTGTEGVLPPLHGLALACLLPFPFRSPAGTPLPSMYWGE